MKTLHVNLWGGSGLGKSTTASEIFYKLKRESIDCELITEYAKELVWSEYTNRLSNQIYILAEQLNRHLILEGKLKVIITDSPFPMGCVYDKNKTKYLKELALDQFNQFNNYNILINRKFNYNENGRVQSEQEAIDKDNEIRDFLYEHKIWYNEIEITDSNIEFIINEIKSLI